MGTAPDKETVYESIMGLLLGALHICIINKQTEKYTLSCMCIYIYVFTGWGIQDYNILPRTGNLGYGDVGDVRRTRTSARGGFFLFGAARLWFGSAWLGSAGFGLAWRAKPHRRKTILPEFLFSSVRLGFGLA